MKKRGFIGLLAFASVFTLISCGNKEGNANVKVLKEKSYIFKEYVSLDGATPVTTYKVKDMADIPYLKAEGIKDFFSTVAGVNLNYKADSSSVTLTKVGNEDSFVKFDAKTNEVSYKNVGLLAEDSDSKIGRDYCLTSGQVIKSSSKTKVGTVGKDEGKVSLNDYNINLVLDNDTIYVPYDLMNVLLLPSSLVPYVYNGKDFFRDPVSLKYNEVTTLCYSGNGMFEYAYTDGGVNYINTYKKVDTKSGQKYTYQAIDIDGKLDSNQPYEFAFYTNGYGTIINSQTGKGITDVEGRITRFKYEEDNGYLSLYISKTDASNETFEPSKEACEKTYLINTDETRFAKTERSKELAEFTYNLMCLTFDKVYSLKEAKGYSSFNAFVTEKNYKENLKSTNVRTYNEAMLKLLSTDIDDGHTIALATSILDYPGQGLINKYPMTRALAIEGKSYNYQADRFPHHNFANDPLYIPEGEDTAYIAFDSFVLNYNIPANFRSYVQDPDLEELRKNDTCGLMAAAILQIEKYNETAAKKVKNIVVDISANTGGVMPVLPYVACIMTKDPMLCVGDSRTGQIIEYHYEADFDGDGIYGDTYADKYNFFLMTSDVSFSCGSALPAMLKGTNVKIIGQAGAGGASPVTAITDASGFVYNSSGQYGIFYKDGTNYKTIENGVPVDYQLDKSLWYDYPNLTKKIQEIVASYSN